jgi:hypothetical protein
MYEYQLTGTKKGGDKMRECGGTVLLCVKYYF